jgi:hypothetical protein
VNGPLFAYDTARSLLVVCEISGKPVAGIPLKAVQAIDPNATHEAFARVLPRPSDGRSLIATGPVPRGLDAKLRRG